MKSKLVLVIEDSWELSYQMSLRLQARDYTVEVAATGNEGLHKARELRPDIILLDLMLPELDGYNLCRLLKFDTEYEKIPVIVITARSLEQDKQLATETGADAYLLKPVDWEVLLQTMENLLAAVGERKKTIPANSR